MSQEGHLFGCILAGGAYPPGEAWEHNEAVIQQIPTEPKFDSGIILLRDMFHAPKRDNLRHRTFNQMITFGLSMNHLTYDLDEVLIQFEGILRQLIWHEAYLFFESEWVPRQEYHWEIDRSQIDNFHQKPPRPIEKWTFTGGERSFKHLYT